MNFEQDYYNRVYHDYLKHNPPYKLDFYLKKINQYAPKARKLIDVGCGPGLFLESASKFYEVYGVEVSDYALKLALERVPQARIKKGSIEEIQIPAQMDVVSAFDVLEHVPDLKKAFSGIKNQLKKEGLALFVVPVYDGLVGRLVDLLDKDETHVHKESRWWWLEKTSEHFEILEWLGIWRYLLPFGIYVNFPTSQLRNYSPSVMIIVRKK